MTNTYLLEVIKALQPSERQEIVVFLASSFNTRSGNALELKRLYQIVLDAAPDFLETQISKETVYPQVFAGQNMVPGKLEKLMAELNKLLRNYILSKRYFNERNEVAQQLDWAAWLREKGLADRSLQVVSKLKGNKVLEIGESFNRFHIEMRIAEEEHIWELTHNQIKGDLKIPQLAYYLNQYFYLYRNELANRYLLQQKGTQLPDLDFSQYDLDFYINKSSLIEISQHFYAVFKKEIPSMLDFEQLLKILNSKEDQLSFETKKELYAYLRSACTLLINSGNTSLILILHLLHKNNLERGYFSINGKMSPNVYMNLVQVAIRVNDYEWAANFTEEYKDLIIGGDEDLYYYKFNVAYILFAKGSFEKALDWLPDAPSNVHYHHLVRILELKIYYETQSDLLLYKIDAFRKFIERTAPKTIAPNLREMDVNFLNILLQLAQSLPKDKARSARLIKRIEEKKLIADRAWLLEKAHALG